MLRSALATRHLPPCLRSSGLVLQLNRGLTIVSWFQETHDAHVKLEGTAIIPRGAESACGHPLGRVASRYRSKYLYLDLPTSDFEELESISFAWCRNEWTYERMVVPALLKYKELHGNMDVPRSFVVPSCDDWPEETWGMKLGYTVNRIRSQGAFVGDDAGRREWLLEQGFMFDVHEQQWERAKLALLKYMELHGNMDVPQRFVVPSCDDWAEETWGMQLGYTVNGIRSKGAYVRDDAGRREWLEGQGLRFEKTASERPHNDARWTNAVVPALLKYKELHGNMDVPFSFVVPSRDDWPEETWGMKLGSTVSSIRSQGAFVSDDAGRREWLLEQGFMFDVHEQQWEQAKLALLKHKELHGNMDVPQRFVVPSCDDWPEEIRGMHLGSKVNSIRVAGSFVRDDDGRREWLERQGFVWELRQSHAERVRAAAKHYGRSRRGAL